MPTWFSMKRVFSMAVAALLFGAGGASACPFCNAESQTLSEETQSADTVVLAKLIKAAEPIKESANSLRGSSSDLGTATFTVVEVLQGQDLLAGTTEIQVVYFGESDPEQVFRITGIRTDRIDWTTPLPLSAAATDYVRKLYRVPPSGVERLAFFLDYLENDEPLLAQDSYDEFARAPYTELIALKPRMQHDRIMHWINDPEVSPSRRRLYLTMLGVCGSDSDLPALESLIASDFQALKPHLEQLIQSGLALGGPLGLPVWMDLVDQVERRKKLGLDALLACYLTLRGPGGLDLVDERFLTNSQTEYTYIYSTIMALRFHGEEPTSTVPRDRLLASMRLLLDNPEFADQVIPDLARWEDWTVLDRLVAMFKASDENGYVRQPVITYLTVASEQPGEVGSQAKTALAELEQIDPQGVKQARSLMAFGVLGRARPSSAKAAADPVATNPPALASAADNSAAFAATVDEIAAAEQAKPGDFPDPADYGLDGPSVDSNPTDPMDAGPLAQEEQVLAPSQVAMDSPKTPVATAGVTSASTAAEAPAAADSQLNMLLVVGVPMAAAVVLLGIYWIILRTGTA